MLTYTVLAGLALLPWLLLASPPAPSDSYFNHDVVLHEPDTGGQLRLQSQGRLSEIIDLDNTPAVKRVLCKDNKVLVALHADAPAPAVPWRAGQLVMGSDAWGCRHNLLRPDSRTVYARVAAVRHPKDGVVELHTTRAGPLDIFEEADIRVHYQQGQTAPSRQRRYLSNPLHKSLQNVTWDAAFTSDIPFNMEPLTGKTINNMFVYKDKNSREPVLDTSDDVTEAGKEFIFQCKACHGHTDMAYYFELKVQKVNNEARVLKYAAQLELGTSIHQQYIMHAGGEVTVTEAGTPWRHLPKQVFQTPVAAFKSFPPILLTVTYTSQANVALTSTAAGPAHYTGDLDVTGKIVISQRQEEGKSHVTNDVSSYNWTAITSRQHVDTNGTLNTSFAFHQNITIFPAISWAQKDIDMNLGPPIHSSIRPTVHILSTSDGTARRFSSDVTVNANISVKQTDFSVDAFGIHIWNVTLMDRLSRKLEVMSQSLLSEHRADCHGDEHVGDDQSMDEICGAATYRVVRGDEHFHVLHQLWGDYVLFMPEGHNKSSWCGHPGRNCIDCTNGIMGDDAPNACATRMMSSQLASSITRLARFVKAEWPHRKLMVTGAWDEPTSTYSDGRHGNLSLFNEGRGATVRLTGLLAADPLPETDSAVLRRLGELAVCSRFPYVTSHPETGSLTMCVKTKDHVVRKRSLLSRRRRSGDVDHSRVDSLLQAVGAATRSQSAVSGAPPPVVLTMNQSYPPGGTMERVCGGYTGTVAQDDIRRFTRLVQYPFNDVEFDPEGPGDTWCGVETRRCRDCSSLPAGDDVWDWCGTRTMGMRLATRLHRLAIFAGTTKVRVAAALTSNNSMSKLHWEGRALRIHVPATLRNFTAIAIQAGFDLVSYPYPGYIEVCAKLQDDLETHLVLFPRANLLGVPLPYGVEAEYDYPTEHVHETRKPLLFDMSTNANAISDHFSLSNFASPGKRYIRLDPILINILELAYAEVAGGLFVIPGSGYRPRSVNRNNIEGRNPKETYRYQMGQAVEVKPGGRVNNDTLFRLGLALMKVAKTIRPLRMGVGVGSKPDRLYFHIRPLTLATDHQALDVWDNGNTALYARLKHIQEQVSNGGSIISARPDDIVCKMPVLGQEYFYFNFDLDEDGHCNTSAHDDMCAQSHAHRYNISRDFQKRLSSAAGSGRLPRPDILPHIEACLLDTCGGCPSAGSVWKQKVVRCTAMITRYLSRASTPFQPLTNKVSIFNTENTQSSVHSQACHDGKICVENTQIYSLLLPVLTATFRAGGGQPPESLFGGADNPSPLLEIVEQELAWRAAGTVGVYIDGGKDISALRNVLKIVMMLNKNVTEVDFYLDPDVDADDVITTLHRKLEQWSGTLCPAWSRLVVPPYRFHTIPHERKRRSLERSKSRNKDKHTMDNWEVDWMLHS